MTANRCQITNLGGSGGEKMYASKSRVWVSCVIGWVRGNGPPCMGN